MKSPRDLTGEVFGRLTVISLYGKAHSTTKWNCRCECGKKKVILRTNLINGDSRSCGCLQKERSSTHGLSKDPLYEVWISMRKRCSSEKCKSYKNYGGRGISVCTDWSDFQAFYNWANSNGYKKGLLLDREDNNGNYEPSNCRWVTRTVQNNNTRKNVFVEIDGVTKTLSEWARFAGLGQKTVYYRWKHGYKGKDLLSKPYSKNKK